MVKLFRYKQVARITLFGNDDLLLNDPNSIYKTQLRGGFYTNEINTKLLKFKIDGNLQNLQLSNNCKLVLESVFLPNLNDYAANAYYQANVATALGHAAFILWYDTYNGAQFAFNAANNALLQSNVAYRQANTGTQLAQAAFNYANTKIDTIEKALANNFTPYYYTTAISNSVNSIVVGGAPVQNAQVWGTYTVTQVLDTILFPTLSPTYTIPSIGLSANNSGTFEIGRSINQSLTITASENDAGPFTQLNITRNGSNIVTNSSPNRTTIGNIAAQYGFNDPNNPNYSYDTSYTDAYTISGGATTWSGYGNYGAGLAKQNNKGAVDGSAFAVRSTTAPQSAATNFGTNSIVITGIYPYFWGKSSTQPTSETIANAIQSGTANKVLAVGSGTLTITYNASSEYVWFAVQTGYGNKSTWYNTALNNGTIGTGQFISSPVSQPVTSPDGYWTGVTYKIYISGYATTTSGSLQFS
jgi:hypothetical protein